MTVRDAIQRMTGYLPGEQPQAEKVIKLNTNENPYPCSPKVKAAIGHVVQQGLARYPDPTATAFRNRASDLLGVDPDWILCGNGSDDILTIITRTFVDAGDTIRFAYPGYILYRTLAEIQGARCDAVPFRPDWTLGDDFAAPGDRLRLALVANPNSPSGTLIPPGRIAELAAALPCPLVVDEAYVDFAESNCLELVARHENVLVTRSLSKSYSLAGLRFGYVVAQPQVVRQLAKVKDSYNCDAISIAAATAAIDDQSWLERTRSAILATRETLAAGVAGLGYAVTPSQANFVWATHPDRQLQAVYEGLKQRGLLIRFLQYPEWGEGIRITVGSDDQNDVFLQWLAEVT